MVTVFGLGFVGLTTALGFAYMGMKVYGVDVNEERKAVLRSGKLPFMEPHMQEELVRLLNDKFFITDDVEEAVRESDYIFYCVGTPYGESGKADLTYLFSAIDATIEAIHDEKYRVLVTKSTIPPSTTADRIVPYVNSKGKVSERIDIANNPEFLREGSCWEDFMEADRIVLGVESRRAEEKLRQLYASMDIPVFAVSFNTGEFIKYLSNTLLATMISYSNEMAQVADAIGNIETGKAFRILHMDKRWNGGKMASYVYPGCGYGGYCLPKDTNALLAQSREKGFLPPILRDVIETNDKIASRLAEKIIKGIDKEETIGILGLSFKPHSDDVRDTPAARIIRELIRRGYGHICAYDPIAIDEFRSHYPELPIQYVQDKESVLKISKVSVILTAWDEFKNLPEENIVDCRYCMED